MRRIMGKTIYVIIVLGIPVEGAKHRWKYGASEVFDIISFVCRKVRWAPVIAIKTCDVLRAVIMMQLPINTIPHFAQLCNLRK